MERGLPVQFRSMVVSVVMSPAVYQLILQRWRAEFLVAEQGFACGILAAWLRLLRPRFVLILLSRPENNASRAGVAEAFASRFLRQRWDCADSLCAVPTGVNAVMSEKSYDEFMEDVYA
jgi:hypothetical protein